LTDRHILELSCEHVITQISNYIDGEISAELRLQVEAHVRGCKHCAAVLEGMSNTLHLLADGRLFELPEGFGERLQNRLAQHLAQE
jgi:anti-sigma factor RsiW